MTTAKLIEYRIIQRLQGRRDPSYSRRRQLALAKRAIQIAAATAIAFLLGTYLQELLWVGLTAGGILVIGSDL